VYAHLREYKFWKDSKKGCNSEGVAEMAVVRYSSMSSFGGFGLFEEDMVQAVREDAQSPCSLGYLFVLVCTHERAHKERTSM
jgi:hypothetical protein